MRSVSGWLCPVIACLALSSSSVLTQAVRVIDGDTLKIGTVIYRLHGIDAPEKHQLCNSANGKTWPCGKAATNMLRSLIEGQFIRCSGKQADRYQRVIAVCYRGTIDLNALMVRTGHAWAYRKYSSDYVTQEQEARTHRHGIWREPTQMAQKYRLQGQGHIDPSKPVGCAIKGNISGNGRIYHTPRSPWYRRTRVTPSKGERWFCTEMEALTAGWRATQRG